MAYVYTHTRLDTNQIFYVGIGSDTSYARANSIKGRNVWWYRIIAKADYKVDILHDNLTWNEACEKEVEIIKQIGRKQDGGTLVNITEGGDGFRSNHTQQTKDQIRDFYKGKSYEDIYGEERANIQRANRKHSVKIVWQNRSLQERKAIAQKNSKPILQYKKDGTFIKEWASASEAERILKTSGTAINHCLRGKCRTSGGFIWKYKNI